MSLHPASDPAFFESMYRGSDDPWNFATSEYEQGRFEAIVRTLAVKRYRHAFEPACSIGTLTVKLAEFCERITACDLSQTAIEHARQRCASWPHVSLACAPFTRETLVAEFDLVVLSELGYYFSRETWLDLVHTMVGNLPPGATVLCSHWLGSHPSHLQTSEEVHNALRSQDLLQLELEEVHPGFRLDRFRRLDPAF
ncbi:MAG: methyltransferase domain-containing protein [Rhodospirillales bacterium]|nr:methyltransferase domain-containing protein [Acetobacter sp.]